MTPELYRTLSDWASSDDPMHRAHAERRLAMSDAIGYAIPEGWTPRPVAAEPSLDVDDAARAAALIAEFPPANLQAPIGRKCCGG